MLSIIKTRRILFLIVIFYAFFGAGVLQMLGLLGVTTGTILISFFIFLFNMIVFYDKKKLTINKFEIVSVLFILYVIVVGEVHQTPILHSLMYTSYVFIPLSLYSLLKVVKTNSKNIFKIFSVISILQLPVLIFQLFFGDVLGQISSKKYSSADSLFGTFPIADDHGLGFFLIAIIGAYLFFYKRVSITGRLVIIFNIIGVLLIGSLVTKLLLLVIFGVYIMNLYNLSFKINFSYALGVGLLIYIVIAHTNFLFFVAEFFDKSELINIGIDKSSSLIEKAFAGRIQTVLYLYNNPILWIGNGPYSYFDPFKNVFTFNQNFSQLIWFYFDIGLIGIFFFFLWLGTLYKSVFKEQHPLKDFLFVAFFLYSFFTTVLNSITIVIIFFTFLYCIKTRCDKNEYHSK